MNPGISHQGFSTPNLNEYRGKQLVGCVVKVSLNIKSFNLTVGLASGPEAVWCLWTHQPTESLCPLSWNLSRGQHLIHSSFLFKHTHTHTFSERPPFRHPTVPPITPSTLILLLYQTPFVLSCKWIFQVAVVAKSFHGHTQRHTHLSCCTCEDTHCHMLTYFSF